ncbi:MAG: lipoate--protein ligase family protein [Candidatus Aminicenantia bacterium]
MVIYIIIEEYPNKPAFNMAMDESIFNFVQKNPGTSVLRFYRWKPPALTIGYAQDASKVADLDFLNKEKIELVRRITGGKAVLHDDEITYSLSSSHPLLVENKSVNESFYLISSALLEGLKILGISATLSTKKFENLYKTNLPCFSYPTGNEITFDGKKLVGSAQKRVKNALIQHGSIPITLDIAKLAKATFSSPLDLKDRVISLKELTRERDFFKFVSAFKEGFSRYFNCKFELFEIEQFSEEVRKLMEKKYLNPEWNIKSSKGEENERYK